MSKEYLLIRIIDMLFKSITFALLINECTNYSKQNEKKRKYFYIAALFLCQFFISLFIKNNIILLLCLFNITGLIITIIIYHKEKLRAVAGFSFVYYILMAYNIFNKDGYKYTIHIIDNDNMHNVIYYNFTEIFLLSIILIILKLKKKSIINMLELIIQNNKLFIMFISGQLILNIILAFIICFGDEYLQGIKIIFAALIFSIMILIINYIENLMKKSRVVEQVNSELEIENNELRKIKHDYGAQVSYLYGMFLLKRWDDLKESLDKIIETNNCISSPFIISSKNDSLIKDALESILDKGVHVVIEENVALENIHITKDDLFFIIRNVGKIFSDLIEQEGIISVKVNLSGKNIVIDAEAFRVGGNINIKNKLEILEKFKTIDYLIKNNNGDIYFNSNKVLMQIKILFPS
ncbi:MAG: hypothetical protein ACI398_00030 [Clostridium sp.]